MNYNLSTQGAATQAAIQGVRYDMATQACDTRNTIQNSTRDIIDNQNANSRAILDFLTQDKIATLTAEKPESEVPGFPGGAERFLHRQSGGPDR